VAVNGLAGGFLPTEGQAGKSEELGVRWLKPGGKEISVRNYWPATVRPQAEIWSSTMKEA